MKAWVLYSSIFVLFYTCNAQCPSGFTRMESNLNKCYKYVQAAGVQADVAFGVCRNLGANVISIQSAAENNELNIVIKNCINDTQNCGSAWIGLLWQNTTSDNSYSWSDGESVGYLNIDHSTQYCNDGFLGQHFYTSWNRLWYNCPYSSYNGHIHGVLCEYLLVKPPTQTPTTSSSTTKRTTPTTTPTTTTTTTRKTTTPSTTTQAPVGNCPAGWYQSLYNKGNCYLFVSSAKDWNTANFQCFAVDQRASLATVEYAFINTEILTTAEKAAPKCNDFFIGLHQDNQYSPWVWINGDTASYRNWRNSYPNYGDHGKNANCGVLNMKDGKWTNDVCIGKSKCYICLGM
uniref:C-type lectin domain-containing protein n=1 Tax=Acrobeloides nanus TaxID=290746 RepID=A0A914DAX2_9BILA